MRTIIIGAIVGALVGLVVYYLKANKK